MFLKEIELIGFKSFADKTNLKFEKGLSVIVGPNGCGKSNLFDAIRWALGEQSIKSLRGKSFEDVVFQGTPKRQGAKFAEVSLIFSNENKFFSIEENEVAICRRIYNTGEIQYFLNRVQVRLKDILELLRGTGIGPDSYFLVEQGKIDIIFSLKPEERRQVFDEASGVSKYKAKRKEAEIKLRETENNLCRITDIIKELERQMNSLERQAKRAKKYKELYTQLLEKEEMLNSYLYTKKIRELEVLRKDIEQKDSQKKNLLQDIEILEEKMRLKKEEISELDTQIQENITTQKVLLTKFTENQSLLASIEANIGELENNLEYLKKREEILSEEMREISLKKDSLFSMISQIEEIKKNKENKIKECQDFIEGSERKIKENDSRLKEINARLITLNSEIVSIENEITELRTSIQILRSRKKRLTLDLQKTKGVLENFSKEVKTKEQNLEELTIKLHEYNAKKQSLVSEIEAKNSEIEKKEFLLKEIEKEKTALLAEKKIIEDLEFSFTQASDKKESLLILQLHTNENIDFILSKPLEIKSKDGKIEIRAESKVLSRNSVNIEEKIKEIDFRVNDTIENLNYLKENSKKLDVELSEVTRKLTEVCQNINQIKDSLEISKKELDKIFQEKEVIEFDLEQVDSEIEKKERDLKSLEEKLEKNQEEIKKLELEKDCKLRENQELSEKINQKKIKIAELRTGLEAQLLKLKETEKVFKELQEDFKKRDEEKREIVQKIKEVERKIQQALFQKKEIYKNMEEIRRKKEEIEKDTEKQNERIAVLKEMFQKEETDLDNKRKELKSIEAALYEQKIQEQKISLEKDNILNRFTELYQRELKTLSDFSIEIDVNALSTEIEDLKRRLKYIGQTDESSINEYENLKERYEFLNAQKQDLEDSRRKLLSAISKINRVSKEMFLEIFEKVKKEFQNYFETLFGKGEAKLFLIDEKDPLESGVDIFIKPPGKKLQSVTLLSGGEKALTGIALLFAIFKAKPAPFSILDEVDAALDEVNIERFSQILKDLARGSQFILISHNKRTISKADIIYGVTMEEEGVSKVVSVKLKEPASLHTSS